ncbi:hypothetical protein AVEN_137484-1 [Araneus ventricosus]|uniref:Uncharacterized protein n=1 Tax=Araneus ventricosus TaxID=182803 RepID=A0A4Y2RGF6_ARAVE|nr:hypothetical protein AVEN_137484-1 [Araneus ventricosus]
MMRQEKQMDIHSLNMMRQEKQMDIHSLNMMRQEKQMDIHSLNMMRQEKQMDIHSLNMMRQEKQMDIHVVLAPEQKSGSSFQRDVRFKDLCPGEWVWFVSGFMAQRPVFGQVAPSNLGSGR